MTLPFVRKLPGILKPDAMRTVIRPFDPGDPAAFAVEGHPRGERIVRRVLSMSRDEVRAEKRRVLAALDERHRDVTALLLRRFEDLAHFVPDGRMLDEPCRELIGAYFSAEYSFEAAALFNPSAVVHPDQSGLEEGATRFLLSLRGIGEGHMSSVTFRTGVWAADGAVRLDDPSPVAVAPRIGRCAPGADANVVELDCGGSREPSETVLFPVIDSQARGIEDVRMTRFVEDDGSVFYGGTYTAVGVSGIRQEVFRTDNFRDFTMRPIRGELADAKGMAFFPRRVDGRFMAIGRQDNENLWLFASDDPFEWTGGRKLLGPEAPWEFIQIGNCGPPIEIEEGWLLLTHGVGVVRAYCMGACLLDKEDPSKVIGRLREPLLEPSGDERDGYVPNVVYSCGGIVRGRTLFLPYGVADNFTSFATVPLDALVAAMR